MENPLRLTPHGGFGRGTLEKNSPWRAPRRAAHPSDWLVRNRRLDRDYERRTATSEAMIKMAMIRLMLLQLAG